MLKNIIIFQGEYDDIRNIREELKLLKNNKKQSRYYNDKTTKNIKKLEIIDEYQQNYLYELKISFNYPQKNIIDLLQTLDTPNVKLAHLCWDEKQELWIVNNTNYIIEFQFIPEFAIHQILLEYMRYKESAIILDSFETIKYDRNSKGIVVNDHKLNHEELIDLVFNKKIKGKEFYIILEEFIHNYHNSCINSYDDINASNKREINGKEEPSPLGLFIVTFGIIGIIFVLIKIMGYL